MKPITREDRIYNGEDVKTLTRDEYFLKKHVKESEGGGSGSSLPPYTASDVGKSLTVVQETETVVVIPEQTVTVTDSTVVLNGTDFSRLSGENLELSVTINDGEYTLTGDVTGNGIDFLYEDEILFYNIYSDENDTVVFYVGALKSGMVIPGSYNIAAAFLAPKATSTIIVPEQTVTLDENGIAALTGVTALPSDFSDGMTAMLIGTYEGQSQPILLTYVALDNVFASGPVGVYYDDGWYVSVNPLSSVDFGVSLSLKTPIVTADWATVSGLPKYSSDNNGMFLGIENGSAAWVSPPDGYYLSTTFDWSLRMSGNVDLQSGVPITLYNSVEHSGMGPLRNYKYIVDYSSVYQYGVPMQSVNDDIEMIMSETVHDIITLSSFQIYPTKTQTVYGNLSLTFPVYIFTPYQDENVQTEMPTVPGKL